MIVSTLSSRAGRAVSLVSAAVLSLALAGGAAAVAAPAPGHGPLGRVWASWAYDPALHEAVLFGGDRGYRHHPFTDTVLGATWTWKRGVWSKQHPAATPSPRTGAAMVYDGATRQLLLFGGSSHPFSGGGYMGDTWSWDGTTWTQLTPPQSPGAVSIAWQAGYDSASQQLLLFGGDGSGGFSFKDGTWAWDGTTWTRLQPATHPGSRAYGSMTYDPDLQRLVLYAGSNTHTDLTTIWEWNGTTWQRG